MAPPPTPSQLDAILALYTNNTRVWIVDDVQGWISATVTTPIHVKGNTVSLTVTTTPNDKDHIITISLDQVSLDSNAQNNPGAKDKVQLPPLRNPPVLEGIEDLTSLSYLHEPAVLHNIKTRYAQHNIYTYSGIVLIAMNPFQKVQQLYTPDVVKAYSGKRRGELEPHLFAVAEDAFRGMIRDNKNQSIIVSGESGAGKTVSAKYIMRYFATADVSSDTINTPKEAVTQQLASASNFDHGLSEVETQVLATNPIMESFGNAKTTRNDNSSRFGKYIELLFDNQYKIIGARLRTYLLERSRVIYQPESERNYHVFYQLCAGAPAAERKELGLQSHTFFQYLNQGGGAGTVPGMDDTQEFDDTQRALSTIGVSVSEQWKIFRLLAAILHLGNLKIQKLGSDESAYIPEDEPSLLFACKLLGVPSTEFLKWLVKKQINTKYEKIVSAVNVTTANTIRDSVAKFLYSGLFEWLVEKINDSLCPASVLDTYTQFIGVLDIYGFEHFKKNSFEQFCINYANEKLQQEFTQHVFKLEQEEYVKEQIQWSFIDFNDNQPCIELIEGKLGILSLLDEESRLPGGQDKSYAEKLYTNFDKKHQFFAKPRFGGQSFIVHHFAHSVEYDVDGFIDKNKDTVPDELLALFSASTFEFLNLTINAHKVNKPTPENQSALSNRTSKSVKQTLGSVFKMSLVQLMDTINSTNVSYIRCIKSNSEKKPFHFEPQMVLSQLRACGVLETIRISTAGYPGRWSFSEFVERYFLLLHSREWGKFKDIRGLCTKLLEHNIADKDKYQIGLTKIFFRAGQLAMLEKMRTERLHRCVVMIQKNMRCWIARKHYLALYKATVIVQARMRGYLARKQCKQIRQTNAATKIQAAFRGHLAFRKYTRIRLAIVQFQSVYRGYVARKGLLGYRRLRAAKKIQATFRMYVVRKQYRLRIRKIVLCQSCIRRYLAKKEFKRLRVEARSVNHFKETSYRLENKVVELTQSLDTKEKQVKALQENVKQLDAQVRTWRDKYETAVIQQTKLQEQLNETGGATREIDALNSNMKGLTSQLNAANDIIKSKESEISALNESVSKLKDDLSKRQGSSTSRGKPMTQQEALILESTQLNALRQEVISLKESLAHEKDQRKTMLKKALHNRQPSVDIVTTDQVWKQLVENGDLDVETGTSNTVSPFNSSHKHVDLSPAIKAMRKMRRYSSSEIWSEDIRNLMQIDNLTLRHGSDTGAHTSPVAAKRNDLVRSSMMGNSVSSARFSQIAAMSPQRNVDEAMMEQEHTFSLLQDPKLVLEIVDGLIRNLDIPKKATQPESSRRHIVFPAHVIGLYAIRLWQHGMNSNLQQFLQQIVVVIEERCITLNYDLEEEISVFWVCNILELESILESASVSASAASAAAAAQRKTSIYMEGERILSRARAELDALMKKVYINWIMIVKNKIKPLIVPCVIENQALPGFVSKDQASLFRKFVSTSQAYTIEEMVDMLSQIWTVIQHYQLEEKLMRSTLSEIFKYIGVHAFNHLIMRRNFATWKRGMQIQYNVSRLTEWCSQHGLTESTLHLERLMQAAKLLQLNKATPANIELYIEDLFDVCFLLSPTQLAKLMSIYTVADFENPISPDILNAVASRSVSSDQQEDLLLLQETSDSDDSWYVKPESRKLNGVEKFLPQELEMGMPRTILLFKFV